MALIANNINAVIVLLYFAIIFIIGIYYRAKSKTIEGYNYVQKSIRTNNLVLAITVFSAAVGGGTTFGLTEKTFSGNAAYSYALLIIIIVDVLVGIYIGPRIAKHYGAIGVGDIMYKYYGKLGRVLSGIAVIISSVGYLAAQISVSSRLLSGIFGINYIPSLLLSFALLTIYTTIGGLRAVIVSNIVQFCSMVIGIPMLTAFAMWKLDFADFMSSIPPEKYSMGSGSVLQDTIFLVLSFAVIICYPSFVQSALLNKDPKLITKAVITKSIVYAIFLIIITINGFIIYYMFPGVGSGLALQKAIDTLVPMGLSGIVMVGFLSAAMSTADTDLNIAGTSVSRDILMPLFNIEKSQHLLAITKITTLIIGIAAVLVSLKFNSILDIVLVVAALWAPFMLVPFVAALFEITVSNRLMALGTILGAISCLIWDELTDSKLQGAFIGTMVHLMCFTASYFRGKMSSRGKMSLRT